MKKVQEDNAQEKGPVQYPLFFMQRFKGRVLFNVAMSEYTSFKIGGPADVMAFPQDEADLVDLIAFAAAKDFPYYILGAGTNLLVRDGGIRGIVINMADGFKDVVWEEGARVSAGSGVRLASLVSKCADRGLSGLEFACGIPGTLGGAVMMNAGAYGYDIGGVIESVEIIDRKGKRGVLSKEDLKFSYRSSAVPPGAVVVRVNLKLYEKDPVAVKEAVKELSARRSQASGSVGLPCAGSVFKNPEGGYAGKLIEEAGFKGEKSGGAMVSDQHANYIVNTGGAKATDVLALMALIRDKVFSAKGVVLEPEIKVIGEDKDTGRPSPVKN